MSAPTDFPTINRAENHVADAAANQAAPVPHLSSGNMVASTPVDLDHFAVITRHGEFYQHIYHRMDAVVADILNNQIDRPDRVIFFNAAEHVCDDVSEDVAQAVAGECYRQQKLVAGAKDFVGNILGNRLIAEMESTGAA